MPLVTAIQDVLKLAQNIDNVALMKKLLELEKLARDTQQELEALRAWNREIVKFKGEAELRDNVYWKKGDAAPFCSNCFDRDGYGIHLVDTAQHWRCPTCGGVYPKPPA